MPTMQPLLTPWTMGRYLRLLSKLRFGRQYSRLSATTTTTTTITTETGSWSHMTEEPPSEQCATQEHGAARGAAYKHFSWMRSLVPCFGLNGRQVEVITEPRSFYNALKKEAENAKQRIVFASLYLGTGHLEQELVDVVYRTAASRLQENNQFKVQILLDYTRGSRGQKNSRTMLLPLVKDFQKNVRVSLFHTPELRGLLRRVLPEKYNETVGLSHIKVYLFDDDLIMSGANLSDSYFTNRQDRYILIRKCRPLADFFANLVSEVSSMSFQLQPDDMVELDPQLEHHPFEDADGGDAFKAEVKRRIEGLIDPAKYPEPFTTDSSGACSQADTMPASPPIDTWVYPLLQMAPFGIATDDAVVQGLLQRAATHGRIQLASGYFNLTEHYQRAIVNDCKADFDILTAAPEANGFFGARFILGAIPDAYTYIAKQFHEQVCHKCQEHRIHLQEYKRPGWTFHGKGLWYYLPHITLPSMTLIGSPNFGHRSVFRDLEAQVAIVTENRHLREHLQEEESQLYSKSTQVTTETFLEPKRRIPLWVTYVTPIIRNFF